MLLQLEASKSGIDKAIFGFFRGLAPHLSR